MSLKLIKINPLDPILFRDGKPFNQDNLVATSIFPPLPSVYYGAIRAIYFSTYPKKLEKANTPDDPTRSIKIKKVYVKTKYIERNKKNGKYKDLLLLPLPKDCVVEKSIKKSIERTGKKTGKVQRLRLKEIDFPSSNPTKYILTPPENMKVESLSNGYFSVDDLHKYLTSNDTFDFYTDDIFKIQEGKIGISIDRNTGIVKEGQLYKLTFNRFINDTEIHIVFSDDGLDFPQHGLMKLGGESKVSEYSIEEFSEEKIELNTKELKRFKVYLSTPAIFKNGWLPSGIDENTLEGTIKGIKVKLLTAAIGRPIMAGGFDMKKREPKPTYWAVPHGSVYYFECLEKCDPKEIIQKIQEESISEINPEQGFGIAYVGGV